MRVSQLEGRIIGVTADRRAGEQIELFERRGASVVHGPTVQTVTLGAEAALRTATEALVDDDLAYFVANTGLGMRLWFDAMRGWVEPGRLHDRLTRARTVARGHKAARVVESMGLDVWRRAPDERLESVLSILLTEGVTDVRVAVQLHGAEAAGFVGALRDAGAEVIELPVYEWRIPADHGPALALARSAADGRLDALTFTSAPAVANLLAIAEEAGLLREVLAACNTSTLVACVGPVCAGAAVAAGIVEPVVPGRARLGPMVREVVDRLTTPTAPAPRPEA